MILQLMQWIGEQSQGLLLLLVGLAIRFIIGRRRFNRRGVGGLQHYNSYALALLVTLAEFIASAIGFFLIVAGGWRLLMGK